MIQYSAIPEMLQEIRDAKSPKMKQMVMEKYKNNDVLQKIIYYTYNPYLKYGISKKVFEKYKPNGVPGEHDSLYGILDELAKSNINDSLRYKFVNFIQCFDEKYKDVMKGIAIKDLNLGVSKTTFNKVWPGLIPTFELQLASRFQNVALEKDEYIYVTEKFDGIRCVCIISDDSIKFFTRQGKEILGLNDIKNDIKNNSLKNVVVDGELLFNGEYEDSGDQYRKTTKIVNSKLEDKKQITFNVFDIVPVNEFQSGESKDKYDVRRTKLSKIIETENLKIAPILYEGTNHDKIMEVHKVMVKNGREGVMVNRNHTYQCKRTTSLLKVKVMSDYDLKIVGYEEGRGENEGKLGAFVVEYKNNTVNVGSGYSKEDRENFWEIKDKLIGRVIKVQFFEETVNQQGLYSLRFPVFIELREEGKEVSYN